MSDGDECRQMRDEAYQQFLRAQERDKRDRGSGNRTGSGHQSRAPASWSPPPPAYSRSAEEVDTSNPRQQQSAYPWFSQSRQSPRGYSGSDYEVTRSGPPQQSSAYRQTISSYSSLADYSTSADTRGTRKPLDQSYEGYESDPFKMNQLKTTLGEREKASTITASPKINPQQEYRNAPGVSDEDASIIHVLMLRSGLSRDTPKDEDWKKICLDVNKVSRTKHDVATIMRQWQYMIDDGRAEQTPASRPWRQRDRNLLGRMNEHAYSCQDMARLLTREVEDVVEYMFEEGISYQWAAERVAERREANKRKQSESRHRGSNPGENESDEDEIREPRFEDVRFRFSNPPPGINVEGVTHEDASIIHIVWTKYHNDSTIPLPQKWEKAHRRFPKHSIEIMQQQWDLMKIDKRSRDPPWQRPWEETDLQLLYQLNREGYVYDKIAHELRRTVPEVIGVMKDNNIRCKASMEAARKAKAKEEKKTDKKKQADQESEFKKWEREEKQEEKRIADDEKQLRKREREEKKRKAEATKDSTSSSKRGRGGRG